MDAATELVTFKSWAQGIFSFDPQATSYIAGASPVFNLHLFLGLTILLLFPFTRLVHMLSAPMRCLWRPGYQVVRTRQRPASVHRAPAERRTMATLYQHPTLAQSLEADGPRESYSGPVEIDVKLPPKARPIFGAVSVNGIAAETDILAEAQHHPAENPGAVLAAAARALVVRELFLQEARRLGLEARPETDQAGRAETEEDALIRALIDREMAVPSATEAECRRFYERNPQRFTSEPIFEARVILLAASPEAKPARNIARQDVEGLIRHLRERPADFAALALQHSDCPSKEQGGNLGQLTRGATVAEFEKALGMMAEGEISAQPVESGK